jgi:multisubunit Na+/H+ antiporter MnhE subunit
MITSFEIASGDVNAIANYENEHGKKCLPIVIRSAQAILAYLGKRMTGLEVVVKLENDIDVIRLEYISSQQHHNIYTVRLEGDSDDQEEWLEYSFGLTPGTRHVDLTEFQTLIENVTQALDEANILTSLT